MKAGLRLPIKASCSTSGGRTALAIKEAECLGIIKVAARGAAEAVEAAAEGLEADGNETRVIAPDAVRAGAYRKWYELGYEPLQAPLRKAYADLHA